MPSRAKRQGGEVAQGLFQPAAEGEAVGVAEGCRQSALVAQALLPHRLLGEGELGPGQAQLVVPSAGSVAAGVWAGAGGIGEQRAGEMGDGQLLLAGQAGLQGGEIDHLAQLAHIARPAVGLQPRHHGPAEHTGAAAAQRALALQEMGRQQGDVVATLPQRGQAQGPGIDRRQPARQSGGGGPDRAGMWQ
jgi:hypothetical protein